MDLVIRDPVGQHNNFERRKLRKTTLNKGVTKMDTPIETSYPTGSHLGSVKDNYVGEVP